MENDEEAKRLDIKTNPESVKTQALWCGIGPGFRVLDVGCGAGKTTSILHELVQPGGEVIGVDFSDDRIRYAKKNYGNFQGIDFHIKDFKKPMKELGEFDFIWLRFVLEYFRREAIEIIKNLIHNLKPDGWLCLLDLDHNCMNHWELPEGIQAMLVDLMNYMEAHHNFDLYAGRKLYTYLYDLKFRNINAHLMAHHLIYGELNDIEAFNWMKKLKVVSPKPPGFSKNILAALMRTSTISSGSLESHAALPTLRLLYAKEGNPRHDNQKGTI